MHSRLVTGGMVGGAFVIVGLGAYLMLMPAGVPYGQQHIGLRPLAEWFQPRREYLWMSSTRPPRVWDTRARLFYTVSRPAKVWQKRGGGFTARDVVWPGGPIWK